MVRPESKIAFLGVLLCHFRRVVDKEAEHDEQAALYPIGVDGKPIDSKPNQGEGEQMSQRSGDFGGEPKVAGEMPQCGAQCSPAVQWKSGYEIEEREEEVRYAQVEDDAAAKQPVGQQEALQNEERDAQQEAARGTGDGNEQLVRGLLRFARHGGNPAEYERA